MFSSFTTIYEGATSIAQITHTALQGFNGPKDEVKPHNFDEVIESITSCATIALLHFKAVKTKLRIEGNQLVFDEVGLLQFTNRQKFGKEDIRNKKILEIAITNPQNWFPINTPQGNAVQRIQVIAKLGLEKLKITYKGFSIVDHIDSYIVKIDDFLNKNEFEEPNPSHTHINEIMQSIWTEANLNHLAELLEQALKEENNQLQADLIQEISEFIKHRVVHFQNKLRIDRNKLYCVNEPSP